MKTTLTFFIWLFLLIPAAEANDPKLIWTVSVASEGNPSKVTKVGDGKTTVSLENGVSCDVMPQTPLVNEFYGEFSRIMLCRKDAWLTGISAACRIPKQHGQPLTASQGEWIGNGGPKGLPVVVNLRCHLAPTNKLYWSLSVSSGIGKGNFAVNPVKEGTVKVVAQNPKSCEVQPLKTTKIRLGVFFSRKLLCDFGNTKVATSAECADNLEGPFLSMNSPGKLEAGPKAPSLTEPSYVLACGYYPATPVH